jgi:hypothetical protein
MPPNDSMPILVPTYLRFETGSLNKYVHRGKVYIHMYEPATFLPKNVGLPCLPVDSQNYLLWL